MIDGYLKEDAEMLRIAILDLYNGHANQGMRCLREIVRLWGNLNQVKVVCDEFDVRQHNEVPDLSYDVYLSSGGPGSPFDGEGTEWEENYFSWISSVQKWNKDSSNQNKKYVFFICHSFQMACRYFDFAEVTERKSTAFGVFPVHVLLTGQADPLFQGLGDPFYVVDSRDWQVINPDFDKLKRLGAEILSIEKFRPHVPLVQAVMSMRFSEYMVGTQFHPEADAIGMSAHLQTEEKKKIVIEQHGEEKWQNMIDHLNDPDKIMCTYAHIIPNFLNQAVSHLSEAVHS